MLGHWFFVGNQAEAKVFTETAAGGKLKLVKSFKNKLAQEKRRSLIRKEAGRGVVSAGRGKGSHYYVESRRRDPREEAAEQFSRELSDYLDKMALADAYYTLTVVAEPRFLGKLRSSMTSRTKKRVENWMSKDLYKTPQVELAKKLGIKSVRLKTRQ